MVTVLIALIAVSSYWILYIPMRDAIKRLMVHNFALSSNAMAENALAIVKRCEEGAASLSSRTMLKRNMLAYREGKLTREELVAIHISPYNEGAAVLEFMSGTIRVMDGQVLAAAGENFDFSSALLSKTQTLTTRFIYEPLAEGAASAGFSRALSLIVVSPIIEAGLTLGYDCVYFDIERAFSRIDAEGTALSVIPAIEALALRAATTEVMPSDFPDLYRRGPDIGLFRIIPDTDAAIIVRGSYDEFFSSGTRFALINLFRFLGILIVLIAGSNIFIVFILRHFLKTMERSRDTFRQYAHQDPLTGLLSRRFLDHWINVDLKSEAPPFTVVMIDLDGFKAINDTFGHERGDAALKLLAEFIGNTLRADDLAIRYGGDEFLLVVRHGDEEVAADILRRLEKRLQEAPFHGETLRISWGLCDTKNQKTTNKAAFEELLKIADTGMYHMKREKKVEYRRKD